MTTDLRLKRLYTSLQPSSHWLLFNVTIRSPRPTWFPHDRRKAVLALLLTSGFMRDWHYNNSFFSGKSKHGIRSASGVWMEPRYKVWRRVDQSPYNHGVSSCTSPDARIHTISRRMHVVCAKRGSYWPKSEGLRASERCAQNAVSRKERKV